MKKWICTMAAALLLTGCASQPTMETVADILTEPEKPAPRAISVALPGETAMPAMESEAGRLYVASDYEIWVQTMPGGDLDATVEAMSGFPASELTVITTESHGNTRHEFVWATAGEGGDLLGRGVVLDDGNYHYTMTVLRSAETAAKSPVVWDGVFASFKVV